MGLAGAYRQPLEARFRTTARAGSGLTSLHVAGRRPVGLWGAHSLPLRALRGLVGRAVTFTGSLGSSRWACVLSTRRHGGVTLLITANHRNALPPPRKHTTHVERMAASRITHNKLTHYHYHRIPQRMSATAPSAAAGTARAAASRPPRPPAAPAGRASAGRVLTAQKRRAVAARRPCTRRSPPRLDPSFRQ